ncbi:hypothetical protein ABZ202_27105 [Streptomyces sp. NPDC006186]|uniref:hypothetical protein n=1 Tax=Streptomyces sp. NPDC006186 TaxID=3155248 RepID=UPI0033AC8B11
MTSKFFLAAAAAALCLTAVAGCSSDEPKREFTVPEALCGVAVPADALGRLLPASGKELKVEQDGGYVEGTGLCAVWVDSDQVMLVSNERIPAQRSAYGVMFRRAHVSGHESDQDKDIVYTASVSLSLVKCRGTGVQEEDISTFIETFKPGRPDESAMKELMTGYKAALEKQQPCHKRYS